MRYQIARLSIIAVSLVCILPIACWSDSSPSTVTYYVDVNHPQASDSASHGSIDRPWKTLQYAFQQLEPGDTLLVRGGTYKNRYIDLTERNSGQKDKPITVKAHPGEVVVLKGGETIKFQGANWWTIEGLTFDEPTSQYIHLGEHTALGHSRTVAAEHTTIRNCEFKNGTKAVIRISYANHILIENNYFHHVRPGKPFRDPGGYEINAIDVAYKGHNIVIRNNRFEEIGSDGVQLGAQSYKSGSSIESVSIVGNEFWVNRPYHGILGNVGENAIDIKKVKGPVLVAGNVVHGFRPTTPQQDVSGANGEGVVVQNSAQNVVVERNLFYDNTIHLSIAKGSGAPRGTRDIIVRNNIFNGARIHNQWGGFALRVASAANVEVYHNTFYGNDIYLRSYDANGVFKNNVIMGGRSSVSQDSAWASDYNAWSKAEDVSHRLRGDHDLWPSDPMLGSNLHPLSGSILIDAGQNVGVPDDFNGTLRSDGLPDLGAIEYKGEFQVFLPFVTKLQPAITVVKTADPTHVDEPGDDVTFTVVVSNDSAGSDPVTITSLVDDVHGDLNGQGNCIVPQRIQPGDSYTCQFTAYVGGNAGYIETGTATASGHDDEGNPVSASDDATVTVDDVPAEIQVIKTATPDHVDEPGDDVTFTFTVNNLSAADEVTIDSLTDTIYGDLNGQGDCAVPQPIPIGDSYSCSITAYVPGNAGDTHTHAVTASGADEDGSPVSASDDATVTVDDVLAAIQVIKTATPDHVEEPGDDVTFTFTVNNLSAADEVTIDSLTDTIYGDLNGQGDCAVPQPIPAGGSYSCSFTAYVPGNAGDVHTNMITASGTDEDGSPVSDQDDTTVTVDDVPAEIQVIRTADPTSVTEPGDNVEFTIEVLNTSTVDTVTLSQIADDEDDDGTDDTFYNAADICDVTVLMPGETAICTFMRYVSGNAGDAITDEATALGTDDDGNLVSDSDGATVTIDDARPAITVDKTAAPTHVDEPGDDVTFTVVVSNDSAGSDPVTITSLVDDVHGDLNGQGNCAVPQTIQSGDSYTCQFTAHVSGNAGYAETSTVTASGHDDEGNPVSASDNATVTVDDVPAEIQVIKTATPDHVDEPGDDVTFTFTVNNLSAADEVTIDSLTDTIYGDLNGQGDCAVPQPIPAGGSYSCSFTAYVSGNAGDTHTHAVTASGADEDGSPVSASDDATVTIIRNPGSITIVKDASKKAYVWDFFGDLGEFSLISGESVTFFDLDPGTYAVLEDGRSFPDGYWTLISVTCQVEGGETFYTEVYDGGDIFCFTGVDIPLEAGQHITCTFLNERADVEE